MFVNELYGLSESPEKVLLNWKAKISYYHMKQDWTTEYMGIIGMRDYLRGFSWLNAVDGEKLHLKLLKTKSNRLKNALAWRFVQKYYRYKKRNFY